MAQIVLVGGSRLFRSGLKSMLRNSGEGIVAEYGSPAEIDDDVRSDRPVIYLLKCASGAIRQEVSALRRIHPEARVAVVSDQLVPADLIEVFSAGGDGLLLEDIRFSSLHESLKLIEAGEKVFPSQLAALLTGACGTADKGLTCAAKDPLTSREMEIIRCIAAGLSNKEIAIKLHLAVATVKVHVRSLLKKLGLHNRTQAAIWAVEAGHVGLPQVTVRPVATNAPPERNAAAVPSSRSIGIRSEDMRLLASS